MHRCELCIEKLYIIKNSLASFDNEMMKKLYAINVQINRHLKQKEVKKD